MKPHPFSERVADLCKELLMRGYVVIKAYVPRSPSGEHFLYFAPGPEPDRYCSLGVFADGGDWIRLKSREDVRDTRLHDHANPLPQILAFLGEPDE